MRVAVITPYYKEPIQWLERCHISVASQSHSCTHFMVADGFPNKTLSGWPIEHIVLPHSHGDNGNTPRGIGAISALNLGYDAFAFLDADNWFAPNHIATLVTAIKNSGAHVAFSGRQVILPDGTLIDGDDPEDASGLHVDTSAFFITKEAAFLLPYWAMMDQPTSPCCDRVMFQLVKHFKVRHVFTGLRSMFFESRYSIHFRLAERPIPEKVHDIDFDRVFSQQSAERSVARTRMNLTIKMAAQDGIVPK